MYKGYVDTNADALRERIKINSNCAYNLEDWIISHIKETPRNILDLGCGTGKQIKALKEKFPTSHITGVDVSNDALDEAKKFADKIINASFDDVDSIPGEYELVISTYSIYYSKDMVKTILDLKRKFNKQLIIIGPGKLTNKEIIDIVNDVEPQALKHNDDFISEDQISLISNKFQSCKLDRLYNWVNFTTAADVMKWWENHNMFVPKLADVVRDVLPDDMKLTKNVLGVFLE